ncbi:MAG TPA: peptide deformylase [Bacteroidetes bacterium]|nr:peptide deformylase [Bacteroidota bacterium]
MLKKVKKYGSTVLRKHSTLVQTDEDIRDMSENLFDTLAQEGGIGLAAPQIGLLKRAFVMVSNPFADDNSEFNRFKQLIINPEILFKSQSETWYTEGCLSIPGIYENVARPEKLIVKYLNKRLEPIEREILGIEARIFQHEFDHLNGILFVDKLSPIKRRMLASKLKRIAKTAK